LKDDNLHYFKDDQIVETKTKHLEYPTPIVFDRPNNLKVVRKQCLFNLKVKLKDLPLKIMAAGQEKAVFRFYLSFSSKFPDHDNYEKRFESNQVILTQEMAKEILKDMLKDPTKREETITSIKGIDLSRTNRSTRINGFRDKKGRNFMSTRETRESRSDFGQTTLASFPSRALLTTMQEEPETTERFPTLEFDYEESDLDDALLCLTFRCFTNSPTIMLTATTQKNMPTKKPFKARSEDFFSPKAIEGLQKALQETREQKRKIIARASTSEQAKLKRLQKPKVIEGESKIALNKKIAKNFLSHRMTRLQKLGTDKPLDIELHVIKAKHQKELMKEEKTAKIELDNQKRLYLRSTREKRELRERLIPFQTISITMLRMFSCLAAMKDRYDSLKKVKLQETKLNRCASKIQSAWMIFMNDHLPIFERQRRNLDVFFASKMIGKLIQEKAHQDSHEVAGAFFKLCHQNVKMKVCFYQSSLYSRPFSDCSCCIATEVQGICQEPTRKSEEPS
jgi:hypothetical protein